jgi:hypothetical protein
MRAVIVTFAVAACGGSDELTCELLADPSNCWATAAQAMADCMPARATPAVLEADRMTCTFGDGVRVLFDAPLPNSTEQLDQLAFTVVASDAPDACARFVDTFHNRMELTGDGKTVVSELLPGSDFHLRCGGKDFSTSFDTLFDCIPQGPPPTDGFEVTQTSVAFSISSVTTPGELFRCEQ